MGVGGSVTFATLSSCEIDPKINKRQDQNIDWLQREDFPQLRPHRADRKCAASPHRHAATCSVAASPNSSAEAFLK